MATKRKLNEEDVFLYNRGDCDFSFQPYMTSMFVNVQAKCNNPNGGIPINVGLLRNTLMSNIGVQRKFEKNDLYVEDTEVAKFLGIDVEVHDLMKTYEEVIALLKGDDSELESYLNDIMDDDNEPISKTMVGLIEKASMDIKLSDMNKVSLIEEYTGRLISEVLDTLREEDKSKSKKKGSPKSNKKGTGFEK